MKKYFHISNRNSGKTNLAVYEFLKDPDNSLLINFKSESLDKIKKSGIIEKKHLNNLIFRLPNIDLNNYKRFIFDDYLFLSVDIREQFIQKINESPAEEIYCFSTPKILYDKKMFYFVKEMKKNKTDFSSKEWLERNEVLVEINDPTIKTKLQVREELCDLFANHLTDPETTIINNKFFYNEKIYKLENVSYFPDIHKESTELRAEYLKND